MRIGIDIDDVITDTETIAMEYVNKHEHEFCDNHEISTNLAFMFRGIIKNDAMKKFAEKYYRKIWQEVKLEENVKVVIDNLRAKGHQIVLITARRTDVIPEIEADTIEYLHKHNLQYDKMIFGTHNKKQSCLDENIDIFIDDSVDTCNDILKDTNITVYLFDSKTNSDLQCDAKRVYNWFELEEIINNYNI